MSLNMTSVSDSFKPGVTKPAAKPAVRALLVTGSPLLLFLGMLVLIFVGEVIVMAALHRLPPQEPLVEAFFDALLLAVISFPALYFLFLKPMSYHLQQRLLHEREAKQARKFDRLKSEFISMAAHELYTPITVMQGYAELLRDFRELTEVQQVEYLDTIYERTEVLERIVNDMLDISRNELGQQLRLKCDSDNLLPVLCGIASSFCIVHPDNTLDVDLPVSLPNLPFDRVRMEQVFGNLLNNAVKFSPAGGRVCLSAKVVDRQIEVIVADRGIGMDSETQKQVFEKFYRADNSPTAKSGLGIGLTVVRQIAEAHGGTVHIDSRTGRGTAVYVRLPVPA